MNQQRRKSIQEAIEKIQQGLADLEIARDEEQEYYDNMPESLQQGTKGDAAQAAIDALESAVSSIEDAVSSAEEASS